MIPGEEHAAKRLRQRYGMAWSFALKADLFARIEEARANDNYHPLACMLPEPAPRERWLVSVWGRVLHVVIEPPVIVTFLPLNAGRPRGAANRP